MIYDLEHYNSFEENCEKDKDGIAITETYLPKTLKYCIENNIKILHNNTNDKDEEEIYVIPCHLMIIRYGYYFSTGNDNIK